MLVEFGIVAADRDAMVRKAETETACARPAVKRSRHSGAHDCAGRNPAPRSRECPEAEYAVDAAKQGAHLPPCRQRRWAVLDALGHGPVPVDLLAGRARRHPAAHLLLRLELAGRVASLPGDCYQRLDASAAAALAVLHSSDEAQPAPPPFSKEP